MSLTPQHTIAICFDKKHSDIAARRLKYLAAHLAYVENHLDMIFVAGPILDRDGETIIGSQYIYNTADHETAISLFKNDPYFKSDIWESVHLHPFYGAAGTAVGGLAFKNNSASS